MSTEKQQIKTIFLVRHATNDWVGKRLAGWTPGVHLNAEGQRQAEALAERLARWPHPPIVALYSSPLERARETAQPVAERLGLDVHIVEDLGEVRYGTWTGGEIETLKNEELWRVVQTWPSAARFPEGESVRDVQCRAVSAVETIAERLEPGQAAVLFSHSDVIRVVVAHYLGVHLDLYQRLVISPASITAIGLTPHGPRVLCVNDTAHVPPPAQDDSSSDKT